MRTTTGVGITGARAAGVTTAEVATIEEIIAGVIGGIIAGADAEVGGWETAEMVTADGNGFVSGTPQTTFLQAEKTTRTNSRPPLPKIVSRSLLVSSGQ